MTAALILAGGKSRRMGENKALVKIGGVPMIERVAAALRPLVSEIIVVARPGDDYSFLGLPVVFDRVPGQGVMMGLATGLDALSADRALAVGCDMPFIAPDLVRFLLETAPEADIVAPHIGEHFEPLFSVYSKGCVEPANRLMEKGEQKIIKLYQLVNVHFVTEDDVRARDPQMRSFLNLNSRMDLEKLAGEGSG